MKPKILKWGAAVMIATVAVALAADITFGDLNPTDTDTFLDLQRKSLAALNANTTAVNANGGGGSSTNFPNGLQFGDGSGGTVNLDTAGNGFWFGTLVSGVETITHILASGSGNVALVNGPTFTGTLNGAAAAFSGSVVANDVNANGSGDGTLSLTNSARTFVYRKLPNSSMTGNVFEREIPAAATGFYYGTASASTNQQKSIKPTIDLGSADASGTLAAARAPAFTGAVTTSAGSLATSLGSFSSANLSTALTDESGTGVALFSTSLYQTKTTSYSILAAESSSVFDNSGAAGTVTLTLPTAVAGMTYQFVVVTAQSLTVKAGTGATIRNAASVSASAGTIAASTVGNVVTLRATSATTWVVVSIIGTWTLT